jgi:beta-lactamase class D
VAAKLGLLKQVIARRITAADMQYMRRTAGYTWTDCKTNAQIAKELKITPIFEQITGIQEKLNTTYK